MTDGDRSGATLAARSGRGRSAQLYRNACGPAISERANALNEWRIAPAADLCDPSHLGREHA